MTERCLTRPRKRKRGFILAAAMVLLFIVVTGAILAARSMMERRRMDARRNEVAKAFYIAEGGASQVVHWTIAPEEYSPDPGLFRAAEDGTLESVKQALANNGEIEIASAALAGFTSSSGEAAGELKSIVLLPAGPTDPPSTEFKVRSVGLSPMGVERSVVYHVAKNALYSTSFPAALISHATAAANGNLRVHWGEVWAKGTINMLNRSMLDHLRAGTRNFDPWARYRTEGTISFPANWIWGTGRDLFDPTRGNPGAAPASGEYAAAFEQSVPRGTLQFPEYDYAVWKRLAQNSGKYYSTDSAGKVYRGSVEDEMHLVPSLMDEFGVKDRDEAEYEIAFIDTVDGNPPAADGSNLAELRLAGNGDGMKGIFYIAANLDASGVGDVPGLDATRPDGVEVRLPRILLDGAFIVEGTVKMTGNASVYGSVVTKRGFTGTGTADIYYNAKLRTRPDAPPFAAPIRLGMFRNY